MSGGVRRDLAGVLALRGVALGGRFVFVIFAAKNMAPDEFGRFGMLQALALIVSAVVGLEAYQVLLRRIQNAPAGEARELRRAYGLFALGATATAALAALMILAVIDWTGAALLLGALIVAGEHLGTEAYRNLVNEHRPGPAVLNVALRTGVWGVLIPALDLIGLLPRPWPLETVLIFWLGGIAAGFAASAPLWRAFLPSGRLSRSNFNAIAKDVLAKSRLWIATIVGWRMIENGGRFVAALLISEAAAGQFTLFSMLASISYVVQKSVVEPVYFPRMVGSEHKKSERPFLLLSLACALVGSAGAIVGWGFLLWMNREWPSNEELFTFGVLLFSYAALTVSQVPHFSLYRLHADRAVAYVTLMSAGTAAALSFALGSILGLPGVAVATAGGAFILLLGKYILVAKLALPQERLG